MLGLRLCKECKYLAAQITGSEDCLIHIQDTTYGGQRKVEARLSRLLPNLCGPEGRWWKEKAEKEGWKKKKEVAVAQMERVAAYLGKESSCPK